MEDNKKFELADEALEQVRGGNYNHYPYCRKCGNYYSMSTLAACPHCGNPTLLRPI